MKKILRAFVLYILSISNISKAEASQEPNQVVFDRLKTFINEQATDSIYAMLSDDFQKQFPASVFKGFMANNIFPLGKINTATLLRYKDGANIYKVDFNTATREVMIASDENGKIAGLSFKPYNGETKVIQKDSKVTSTNKLRNELEKNIDAIAREYIDLQHTVGLAIGIWKDGQMHTYGYGETAKGSGKIPDGNTLFEIGSISKTFTGTLLAWYVGEGKIMLNDPITKYLPDSVAANKNLKGITISMLANHTSGLPGVPGNMGLDNEQVQLNPYRNYGREDMFSFLKNYAIDTKPGEKYGYSNLAVGLLGVILERIGGMSYEALVKKIICEPVHMEHTVQHLDADAKKKMVAVYNEQGKEVPAWDFDAMAAAGCLRSTVHDLLLYASANERANSYKLDNAMKLAHSVTFKNNGQPVGLGWHYLSVKGRDILWHNGGTGGSSSFLGIDINRKIAVVALANSEQDVDNISLELLKLLLKS